MNHLQVLREVTERGLGLTVSGTAAQAAEASSFPLTLLQHDIAGRTDVQIKDNGERETP